MSPYVENKRIDKDSFGDFLEERDNGFALREFSAGADPECLRSVSRGSYLKQKQFAQKIVRIF